MTVVNAMIFNANEGAMIADRQVNYGNRKRNIADKILALETPWNMQVLVGGTGYMSEITATYFDIHKTYTKVKKESKKRSFDQDDADVFKHVDEFAFMLSRITLTERRKVINLLMKAKYNITEEEFKTKDNMSSALWDEILELYRGDSDAVGDRFDSQFLVLGKDKDGLRMYTVEFGEAPEYVPLTYANIGSGFDQSDNAIARDLENRQRMKQKNLTLIEGIEQLLRATNDSSRSNQGVGGIPSIYYISGTEKSSKIYALGEKESLLASEIVKVRDGNLLSKKVCEESLEKLIYGKEDAAKVQRAAFKKNSVAINEFLRGYK